MHRLVRFPHPDTVAVSKEACNADPTRWFRLSVLVRRPTIPSSASSNACPGIGRRIGDNPTTKTLVPIRYITANNSGTTTSSTNATTTRSNLFTKSDVDIQKENKFKQILEQSTVDLSQ